MSSVRKGGAGRPVPVEEDRLISWLRQRAAQQGADRLGDDAALVPAPGWAVTVDQQIEEVHFLRGTPPEIVARRLLAVNLSDLAAMGARPVFALLTVAAPPDFPFRRFHNALLRACRRHGVELAGGDHSRSGRLHTTLTLLGRKPSGGRWLRRANGRAGDRLWVGGSLGEAAIGRLLLAAGARSESRRIVLPRQFTAPQPLAAAARRAVRRHLAPEPQLDLASWLTRRRRAAAIDVSDGLLLDLRRLCRESGVSATIDATELPLAPRADDLATRLGHEAVELALTGGEDYTLLFSLPRRAVPPPRFRCTAIGELRPGAGVRAEGAPGGAPSRPGWDHFGS